MTQPREGSPNLDGAARDAAWLERNQELLDLCRQGLTSTVIAQRLGKSVTTVNKDLDRLRDMGALETGA